MNKVRSDNRLDMNMEKSRVKILVSFSLIFNNTSVFSAEQIIFIYFFIVFTLNNETPAGIMSYIMEIFNI